MTDVALWTCQSTDNLFGRTMRSTFTHDGDTFVATSSEVDLAAVHSARTGPVIADAGVGELLVGIAVSATLVLVVSKIVGQSVAYAARRANRSTRADVPPTSDE